MSDAGLKKAPLRDPVAEFHGWHYLRHNQRRQEHLASLGLRLDQRTVLEVDAGIGDHTSFFLDRGCSVVTTEGRPENLALLEQRYPELQPRLLDLDDPDPAFAESAEIVYCYGTLYHLARPDEAIAFLAACTSDILLLETCVSPGTDEQQFPVSEDIANPSQAVSGHGCRPTRPWVWARLARHFPHVYMTTTQPWHEEFPLTWDFEPTPEELTRAVFIASRRAITNSDVVMATIPERQVRH